MKLSKRISKIIEYIDIQDKVADIGCDHGYLGMGCLEKGVSFVQNIDNKEGPLSIARNNLKNYNNKNVVFTLCNGLDELNEAVDTVVISGMGGDLISQIVENNLFKAKKMKKLILVAHSRVPLLRKNISKDFEIVDEDLVEDNDKIYEIIVVSPNKTVSYTEEDLLLGPILKNKRGELFLKKLTKRLNEINKIIDNTDVVLENLKKEKEMIIKVLEK